MAFATGVLEQAVIIAANENPAVLRKSRRVHSTEVVSKSAGPARGLTDSPTSFVIQYFFSSDIN